MAVTRRYVCLLVLISTRCLPLRAEDVEFRAKVAPFLAKNCYSCHNPKLKTANLSFDSGVTPKDLVVWEKVLDRLSTGKMPPPGLPVPPKTEIAAVTHWIEGLLGPPGADPGRVTARRLNRAEYNNTVRDLLGVSLQPADEFPLDDSGYGFDNIGDVLSLSPMLMEKYINAARKLSSVAVFGEQYSPKATKLARFLVKKNQDDTASGPSVLPFSMRGALYGSFNFPVDAEYEFRMRLTNYRARGRGKPSTEEDNRKAYPPVEMIFKLDGEPIKTDVVEGNIDYRYTRAESTVRYRVRAGRHDLRASFPEFADLPDPRNNMNPDGRRQVYVEYLDIVGPYNPTADPPASYGRIFVCGHKRGGHNPECSRRVVENLARRAYRRPATPQEVDRLTGLVAMVQKDGESFEEGVRIAVQSVLVSPQFLFRVEHDGAGAYPVSNFELASRLSYFLWSSMPDDELMRAALREPGVLEGQIRRLLASPKSDALVENFASQWLNLRLLDRKRPDGAQFPTVDDELVDAMRRETTLFTEAVVREDRSILDFLDGRFTFVNGILARHYGIPGIKGEAFQRVDLDGDQRSGVMTQGSILTLSSYANRTSPVIRGKWVLENLLGTSLPPPPPDVAALQEANLGTEASLRQRLEQHRANATCAVCHNQMDPIGFGLENYDAAGAWRTHDGKFPIDSSGVLPDGTAVNGPKNLKEILRGRSDGFSRNFAEKLLTYALGRGLEPYDRAAVNQIVENAAAKDHRFSAYVMEIVNSKPFQMRRGEGGSNGSR
ncbi:MAG: DUF1592 domain-containing protein [Bryobacteraceae bacterium]